MICKNEFNDKCLYGINVLQLKAQRNGHLVLFAHADILRLQNYRAMCQYL